VLEVESVSEVLEFAGAMRPAGWNQGGSHAAHLEFY
jgi:hypothetical protein